MLVTWLCYSRDEITTHLIKLTRVLSFSWKTNTLLVAHFCYCIWWNHMLLGKAMKRPTDKITLTIIVYVEIRTHPKKVSYLSEALTTVI